jgi:hypothetical protein
MLVSVHLQVAAHVRDALRMQKPLLIGQMAMHGPPHRQRALHQVVLGYLASVGKQGMPVAGEATELCCNCE